MPDRSFHLLAAPWHTAAMIAMLLIPVSWQLVHLNAGRNLAVAGTSDVRIKFYAISVAANLGLAYFCWVGVHWNGGELSDITGPGSLSKSGVLRDVLITIGFFAIWEAVARATSYLLGPDQVSGSVRVLLPNGFAEIVMWIAVSVTAGVCEELIFRGYLQR